MWGIKGKEIKLKFAPIPTLISLLYLEKNK